MKIYLAARYGRRSEMQDVAGLLEKYGHQITSRWHGKPSLDDGKQPDSGVGLDNAGKLAEEDLHDIMEAGVVISFTELPGETHRGSRHAEFGYGLAFQKRMVIVGHREILFHCLPSVMRFDTLEEMMKWIPRKTETPKPNTDGASGALFANEPSGAAAAIAGR